MIYYLGEEKLSAKSTTKEEILEFCNKQSILGVDTETTDLHPQVGKLLLVQLGNEVDQYIVDVRTEDISFLKEVLERIPCIFHNAKFDLRFLFKHGIYPYLNVIDTFLAEGVIGAGTDTPLSYAACCFRYFGLTISKNERNLFKKSIINDLTVTYGARDVQHLIPLWNFQKKKIELENLQETINLEFLYVPALAYIEDCGMFIDQSKWQTKIEYDEAQLNKALDKLDELYFRHSKVVQSSLFGNSSMNWGSSPQVLRFLHKLGISPVDKHGKNTTNGKVLLNYVKTHEVVPALLNFKKHQKNCSTYGESFLTLCNSFPDKRIRTSFRQILKTGRLGSGSSDESSLKEANLQNIPSDTYTKDCFVPAKGNIYVIADYSQQEQCILANQSQNQALLAFFSSGEGDACIHCFRVRKMYPELEGFTDDEIKEKHKDKRHIAKICGFTLNYGGNARTISYNLGLSEEEGIRIFNDYMNSMPGLAEYYDNKERQTIRDGYIFTNDVIKRRIYLKEIKELRELDASLDWDDYRAHKRVESPHYIEHYKPLMRLRAQLRSTIRKASMNMPIQSTGADMMKLAGIEFFHWVVENNYLYVVLMSNMVHDEYVFEPREDLKEVVSERLRESMLNASKPFCHTVPMKLSIMCTNKWEH